MIAGRSQRHWMKVGWRLLRPHTLTASFIPVLVGAALAWTATGRLHLGLLLAMLAASMMIQAATNMFNEYFDYMRGLDTVESVGIAGAITKDGLQPRFVLRGALLLLLLATMLGVYICVRSSWWLAAIGGVCMLVGYLYTGGPYPIAATPFGEIFAGGFMGSGIVLLSSFIQQGSVTARDVLASIPIAILIAAILTANNIRDLEGDRKNGRRTLAILLGHKRAVLFLAFSLMAANMWVSALVALKVLSPWTLIVLASLGPSAAAIRIFSPGGEPARMMPGMKRVAQTNTLFGILLVAGLLLGERF